MILARALRICVDKILQPLQLGHHSSLSLSTHSDSYCLWGVESELPTFTPAIYDMGRERDNPGKQ